MADQIYRYLLKNVRLTRSDGSKFYAPVYYRKQVKEVSALFFMGQIIFYAYDKYISDRILQAIYEDNVNTPILKDYIMDRPFYVNGSYIYKLGKRIELSYIDDESKRGLPFTFNQEDSYFLNYVSEFKDYLTDRLNYFINLMGFKLDRKFSIQIDVLDKFWSTISFETETISIDPRLYAYTPDIIDSVLVSILSILQTKIINTRIKDCEVLSSIVKAESPNYLKDFDCIRKGYFEGEDYLLKQNTISNFQTLESVSRW